MEGDTKKLIAGWLTAAAMGLGGVGNHQMTKTDHAEELRIKVAAEVEKARIAAVSEEKRRADTVAFVETQRASDLAQFKYTLEVFTDACDRSYAALRDSCEGRGRSEL